MIERKARDMTKNEALNTLIAHGCCVSDFGMCNKCPWNHTDNCRDTKCSDVIEEAVNIMLEEIKK